MTTSAVRTSVSPDTLAKVTRLFNGTLGDMLADTPLARIDEVGWAWLYALHVRSAVARARTWQAVHMLEGLRERVVRLACLRLDLPVEQGRGVDRLPAGLRADLADTLVRQLDADHLVGRLEALVRLLLDEVRRVDPDDADALDRTLHDLVRSIPR